VATTEAARRTTGAVVQRQLQAAPATIDLGGKLVSTWAYNATVPGPEIRLNAGDRLQVSLTNQLPDPTTVHWHGLALRNDMDGVPELTMKPVAPGAGFDYDFIVPDPGTYWFHPHVGVQIDTGLLAALIVADPNEPGAYDQEAVLILDDWTDGLGDSPTAVLDRMRAQGMQMAGGGMGDMSNMSGMNMAPPSPDQPLGTDTGDVKYPAHLINGKLPTAPTTIASTPGNRIRFRLINAGSDTAYRFAIGGHRLTVTHTDGFGVQPVEVDALVIGMGERYDVVVTAGDGAFPIVAVPEGKPDPAALAVLRTASGPTPSADPRPAELTRKILTYGDLAPTAAATLAPRAPDREIALDLQMADGGRRWLLNGAAYGDHKSLDIRSGERVRLTMSNQSMMFHPMHLHGHTFALATGPGAGIRKDTAIVLPLQTLTVDFQADNPGQWLTHCHNIYHGELGMMTVVSYVV